MLFYQRSDADLELAETPSPLEVRSFAPLGNDILAHPFLFSQTGPRP